MNFHIVLPTFLFVPKQIRRHDHRLRNKQQRRLQLANLFIIKHENGSPHPFSNKLNRPQRGPPLYTTILPWTARTNKESTSHFFFFIRKLTFHTFSSNFLLLHFLLCCSLLTPLLDHVPCRKLTCLEGKFRTYTEFASHIPTSWSRENVPFFACVTNVFMGAASLKIGFPEKLCKLCGSVSARLSSLKTMVGKNEVG